MVVTLVLAVPPDALVPVVLDVSPGVLDTAATFAPPEDGVLDNQNISPFVAA